MDPLGFSAATPVAPDGQAPTAFPLELFAALGSGETAGTRAWFVVAGLVSITFGIVLASRPDEGAISLAVIYGIFSLAFGITQIVLGVQARHAPVPSADRLAAA